MAQGRVPHYRYETLLVTIRRPQVILKFRVPRIVECIGVYLRQVQNQVDELLVAAKHYVSHQIISKSLTDH